MKSPADLRTVLKRQWQNRALRETRLLGSESVWPLVVSIGRPSPRRIRAEFDVIKRHVELWRAVKVGEVVWDSIQYRAVHAPVAIPTGWKLRKPSEWIEACADRTIREEFEAMATLVEQSNAELHPLFVRQRSLWRGKPLNEVLQAVRLAMALKAGIANGLPLRALSIEGIDTKFFERHDQLVTSLLDARFDGEVSKIGLGPFLGAAKEGEHWLLVVDLDGSLLPFQKQRIRSSELRDTPLPGTRLLIVENECCQHLLPNVPGTLAVLGSGFDLDWVFGVASKTKRIAYWGDIDTWGLQFLATARRAVNHLEVLMMSEDVFNQFANLRVTEPIVADIDPPTMLSQAEQSLYRRLLSEPLGRLEQEFLPLEHIHETVLNWANS